MRAANMLKIKTKPTKVIKNVEEVHQNYLKNGDEILFFKKTSAKSERKMLQCKKEM